MPYWTDEQPIIAYGEKIMLVLFPEHKKLQVAQIWESAPNDRKQGKTIVIGEEDMTAEMSTILAQWLGVTS